MAIPVHVKHAGRVHDVELNPDLPPLEFKNAIYQVTGVPTDRMKVMVKGGILKVCSDIGHCIVANGVTFDPQDDADWKRIAPKAVCL